MKRLVIFIGLILLIVSCAPDKKVTAEYLVGNWDCNLVKIQQVPTQKTHIYDEISRSQTELKVNFNKNNDKLMMTMGNERPILFNLNELYEEPTTVRNDMADVIVIHKSIEKESKNKFMLAIRTEVSLFEVSKIADPYKLENREMTCSRIE